MRLFAHRALVHAARLHYAQPHRGYHNAGHLDELIVLAREHTPDLDEAEQLALLFHDAVYVPGAAKGDNERLSAVLMKATVATLARADETLAVSGDRSRAGCPHHRGDDAFQRSARRGGAGLRSRPLAACVTVGSVPAACARHPARISASGRRRARVLGGAPRLLRVDARQAAPVRDGLFRRALRGDGAVQHASRAAARILSALRAPALRCSSERCTEARFRSAYPASIMSIWPVISGEVGLTLLGHEPTSLPVLSIRYLWKFHFGATASPPSPEIHW